MTSACNAFLEASERPDDRRLKEALRTLSEKMTREVRALHALRPDTIPGDEPGSLALGTSP
jgi:hypothetical protein